MPSGKPHVLKALNKFKMMLLVIERGEVVLIKSFENI